MSHGADTPKRIKAAIITEIISPYRVPVFNHLAADPRIDLEFLFLSETVPIRSWGVPKEKIDFSYRVLKGLWLAIHRVLIAFGTRANVGTAKSPDVAYKFRVYRSRHESSPINYGGLFRLHLLQSLLTDQPYNQD